MLETPRLSQEAFPTDARYIDSRCNFIVPLDQILDLIYGNEEFLSDYGLHIGESLIIINWILRRILNELNIRVIDFSQDSNLEEFFQDKIAAKGDHLGFLAVIRNLLTRSDFEPTVVQAFFDGENLVISFGATNVHKLLREQQQLRAKNPE